jgi:hypothetical protein
MKLQLLGAKKVKGDLPPSKVAKVFDKKTEDLKKGKKRG